MRNEFPRWLVLLLATLICCGQSWSAEGDKEASENQQAVLEQVAATARAALSEKQRAVVDECLIALRRPGPPINKISPLSIVRDQGNEAVASILPDTVRLLRTERDPDLTLSVLGCLLRIPEKLPASLSPLIADRLTDSDPQVRDLAGIILEQQKRKAPAKP